MLKYEALCPNCGKYHEYFETISRRENTPECCGDKTVKMVLTAPRGVFDIAPWDSFQSPATGKIITSKAERRADMKRSGCRDWEGLAAEKDRAAEINKREDEKLDKKLDESIRKAWAQLSPEVKAKTLKETKI